MNWRQIADEKEKYHAYLCSREWSEKREAVRDRADGRCERCEILPMDACHHLTYIRKYDERLEDLQAICNPCHEFTHGKSGFDPVANVQFIWFLSQAITACKDVPGWMSCGYKLRFPQCIFREINHPNIFSMWMSHRERLRGFKEGFIRGAHDCDVTEDQLDERFGDYVDGEVSEIALVVKEAFGLQDQAYWIWLHRDSPCESPAGDCDSYSQCVELAKRIAR